MGATMPSAAGNATLRDEGGFGGDRSTIQMSYEFMRLARSLWPRKTAAELAYRTGVSERAAEFWLAGKYAISIEHARKLIQSEEGEYFLASFLGDARPQWWTRIKAANEIAKLRQESAALQKRLSGAVSSVEQLELRMGRHSAD